MTPPEKEIKSGPGILVIPEFDCTRNFYKTKEWYSLKQTCQ